MARETVAFSGELEQLLVTIHRRDGLTGEVEAGGVEVETLGVGEGSIPVTWTRAHRRLDRTVERFRPDVLHTSLYTGNAIGQSVAIRRSIPVRSCGRSFNSDAGWHSCAAPRRSSSPISTRLGARFTKAPSPQAQSRGRASSNASSEYLRWADRRRRC